MEPVIAAIQKAFPDYQYEAIFSSTNKKSAIGVDVYCPNEVFHEDVPTITLSIHDDEILINTLGRCEHIVNQVNKKGMSGIHVLTRIMDMAMELKPLGIKRLRLKDASRVQYPNIQPFRSCTFSLAGYKILTSKEHHSWYNSLGFRSDTYEEEVKHNTAFAEQPMIRLLRMTSTHQAVKKKDPLGSFSRLFSKNKPAKKRENIENITKTDALVKSMLEVYEGTVTPDMPIQEGIQRIHRMALQATSCKDLRITLYKEMMDAAFEYGIRYDNQLTYVL